MTAEISMTAAEVPPLREREEGDPAAELSLQQRLGRRWIDRENSMYLTGRRFRDLKEIDWGERIAARKIDPNRTLVFLNDGKDALMRLPLLQRFGFRHLVVEVRTVCVRCDCCMRAVIALC